MALTRGWNGGILFSENANGQRRKRGVDLAISFTMEEYLNLKKPELLEDFGTNWKQLKSMGVALRT